MESRIDGRQDLNPQPSGYKADVSNSVRHRIESIVLGYRQSINLGYRQSINLGYKQSINVAIMGFTCNNGLYLQ